MSSLYFCDELWDCQQFLLLFIHSIIICINIYYFIITQLHWALSYNHILHENIKGL